MRVIFTVLNKPALRNGSSAENFSAASRLAVLGERSPGEHEDVHVALQIGEMRLASRFADRQAVRPVFVIHDVEHAFPSRCLFLNRSPIRRRSDRRSTSASSGWAPPIA